MYKLMIGLMLSVVSLNAAATTDARLADAVMRGDQAAVLSLLKQQNIDVNASQPDGTTALHWAVRRDDIEAVRVLIASGAGVNTPTRYGVTPLYVASVNGNAAVMEALVRAGADPNGVNPGGESVLMTATRTGKVDAVKLLIDKGAEVNQRERMRGQTALMWAVLENHLDVARLLIAHGAGINAQTDVSVPDGMKESITRPGGERANSADIGGHGPGVYRPRAIPTPSGAMTPLLFAAREGHLEMARILAAANADLNKPSANGTSPLVVAITNNHIEFAMWLLERGANPNVADDYYKRTPLFAAVEARNRDFTRDTPPPMADAKDPMDLIKALLARGADPNARANTTPVRGFMQVSASWVNFDGQTPFIRAALAGDVTVMLLLLKYGADPNIATYNGTTAMMAAAGINWVVAQTYSRSDVEYLEAVKLCLELGADISATNSLRFTAMHGAANRGFDAMVRLLVDHGAKIDVMDSQGRTPMTFAEGVFLAVRPPERKPSTIALLKELGAAAEARKP